MTGTNFWRSYRWTPGSTWHHIRDYLPSQLTSSVRQTSRETGTCGMLGQRW
ncbi:hypothetical protein CRM22_011163, partial [Opisthorchis felineus]